MTKLKIALSTMALAFSAMNGAQAGVLDLGLNGANIFAFNDFTLTSGSVGGSVVAGHNISLGNVSINTANKDAYGTAANGDGGYSVIAGNNLTATSGSINNGKTYVGGTSSIPSYFSPAVTGTPPASLSTLASSLTSTSSSLSQVAATGSTAVQYGGLNITGSNKSVEVFNVSGSSLSSTTYFSLNNVASGATLIFNVSGTSDSLQGGSTSFGSNYNVLFNFYEATSLTVSNSSVSGSILAPLATFSGGSGSISGNVVVNNWNSNVTLGAGTGFSAATVQGLTSPVPEPETYAMLLGGLGLVGWMARRRKRA